MQQSGGCKIQMQQKDDMAPDAKQRGVNLTGTLAQVFVMSVIPGPF